MANTASLENLLAMAETANEHELSRHKNKMRQLEKTEAEIKQRIKELSKGGGGLVYGTY